MFNKDIPHLYAICDFESCNKYKLSVESFSDAFFKGGGKILQYRDKVSSLEKYKENIKSLIFIANKYKNTIIILNEYHENFFYSNYLSKQIGFHFGQNDLNKINQLNKNNLVGLSTHNIDEINIALKYKPNYVAIGPMYNSKVKPKLPPILKKKKIDINYDNINYDIVLIGGITKKNIHKLPYNEKIYYAIISDFFVYGSQKENIITYTKEIIDILNSQSYFQNSQSIF